MGGPVLVVDDQPLMCTALARVVGREWTPIAATTVDAALAVIDARPELVAVISDYELDHGRSGTEILERARSLRPRAPRILVSAALDEALVTAFTVSGLADRCLAKPFDPTTLLDVLRAAIQAREATPEPQLARGTERPSTQKRDQVSSLFERYQNPRHYPRYPIELAVEVQARSWGEACEARTRDLAMGGLCCMMSRGPELGEIADLQIRLPSGVRLHLPASVRHVAAIDSPAGRRYRVGFEFEPVEETRRDLLKAALARLAER